GLAKKQFRMLHFSVNAISGHAPYNDTRKEPFTLIFSSRKLALTLSSFALLASAALFSACDTGGGAPTTTPLVAATTVPSSTVSVAVPKPVATRAANAPSSMGSATVPRAVSTAAGTVPSALSTAAITILLGTPTAKK
ncbi:MAG: hypothetical protein M3014_01025, partial [Chloroflexota bacterium]|nr:hypothetical protein [Chloroflexota bacterium]